MPYQLNSSRLFLTYPECPIKKEDALKLLIEKGLDIEEYIIAEELHQNGNKHLHAFLKLSTSFRTRDPKFFDLNAYHGNYQGCRSEKNVVKYCSKNEDYISNFDLNERLLKKNSHKKIYGLKLIQRQNSLAELVDENPELLFGYKRLKEDLNEYFRDKGDSRGQLPGYLPNTWGKVLPINLRVVKKRHYWIYSSGPNKGKTTNAKTWYKDYKSHIQCSDFSYWGLNGDEGLIILDEYNTAKLNWSTLNAMADGTMGYRVFQRGVIKLDDPLIVILSNKSINELYPNTNLFLYARFIEIELV